MCFAIDSFVCSSHHFNLLCTVHYCNIIVCMLSVSCVRMCGWLFVNQGSVIWHHVNHQQQSWTGEVSHLQPQSLMAAVSAQFMSLSSRHLFSTGMQWSHCVYNVTERMSTRS